MELTQVQKKYILKNAVPHYVLGKNAEMIAVGDLVVVVEMKNAIIINAVLL